MQSPIKNKGNTLERLPSKWVCSWVLQTWVLVVAFFQQNLIKKTSAMNVWLYPLNELMND